MRIHTVHRLWRYYLCWIRRLHLSKSFAQYVRPFDVFNLCAFAASLSLALDELHPPVQLLAFTSFGAYLCNCCSGLSYLTTCASLTLAFEIGSSYHKSPLPIASASHAFAFRIDDVMHDSLLSKPCTHSMSSTFAPLPLYATCTSRITTGMGSQIGVGIYDSINESLLPFTSTSFALAFILLLPLYDLRVIKCVIESSLLSTFIWLVWSVHALLAFVFSIAMLWQDAFTVVMGHIRTLYHFISLTLCHLQ